MLTLSEPDQRVKTIIALGEKEDGQLLIAKVGTAALPTTMATR